MGRDVVSNKVEPIVTHAAPGGAGTSAPIPEPPSPDKGGPLSNYLERLYKIIPAELTAAYLAIASLLTDKSNMLRNVHLLLGFAVLLTVLTPFYLYRFQNVRTVSQLIVSTISFPVWAICISTAVVTLALPFITSEMVTVLMVGWVLVTPLLVSDR